MYERLTVFLPEFESEQSSECFDKTIGAFDDAIMAFAEEHSNMGFRQYYTILESAGISLDHDPMRCGRISALDGKTVVALLVWAMRADRFSQGSLLRYYRDGSVENCLKRLKQIDQGGGAADEQT